MYETTIVPCNVHFYNSYYSGTCLKRSPSGQKYLSFVERWLPNSISLHKAAIDHTLRFGLYTKVPGTYILRFSYKKYINLATLQYIAYLHRRQISRKEPEATLSLETAVELIMILATKSVSKNRGFLKDGELLTTQLQIQESR